MQRHCPRTPLLKSGLVDVCDTGNEAARRVHVFLRHAHHRIQTGPRCRRSALHMAPTGARPRPDRSWCRTAVVFPGPGYGLDSMPTSQAMRQPALLCGGYRTPNNGVAERQLDEPNVRIRSEMPYRHMHSLAVVV